MKLIPFVSRRTLLREITEMGRSYRREIDEANARARRAEERFDSLVHAAHVAKDFDGTVRLMARIEPKLTREPDHEFAETLARRICEMLYGVHKDWRRDLLTGQPKDLREDSRSCNSTKGAR